MTIAVDTIRFLSALTAVWLVLNSGFLPFSDKIQNEIIPVLPWWALVSAGSYALGSLGNDVRTIKDKPEKHTELMNQISEAKTELKANGFVFRE